MKIINHAITAFFFALLSSSSAYAQWNIDFGDTTFKIPIQLFDETTGDEFTAASSLNCRRSKNGVDGACAGTSAEQSEANHPGLWHYTPGAGDVDTAGSLIIRFTATGADPFRSANQIGPVPSNIVAVNGTDVPNLYLGQLVSDAGGATLTLESGDVPTTGAFNNGFAIVFYATSGAPKAKACILTSTSPDTVVTVSDISSLITNGDNYNIKEASACQGILASTQTFDNTGTWTGDVTGSIGSLDVQAKADVNLEADTALNDYGALKPTVLGRTLDVSTTGEGGVDFSNVGGQLGGSEIEKTGYSLATSQAFNNTGTWTGNLSGTIGGLEAAALKDFFDTNSTSTYGAAVAGSVVKEIADNAGGGGSGICTNLADIWDEGRQDHLLPGTYGELFQSAGAGEIGIAQSVTTSGLVMAAPADFRDDDLKNQRSVKILSAGAGTGQIRCICGNVRSTDALTLCTPWKTTPTAPVVYQLIDTPKCN